MSTLIIPACGESSRFPGMRPKWLLTHPKSGSPMFLEAIDGLPIDNLNKVYLVILQKHRDEYLADNFLQKNPYIEVVTLNESKSQPDTVYQLIKRMGVRGPIHIKDSDNYIKANFGMGNYVGTVDLNDVDEINAKSKSYADFDEYGDIRNIVEKRVISNRFCCGLYGFADAQKFCEYYEAISSRVDPKTLYVSHIIFGMILNGHRFANENCYEYIDWGTSREWLDYCSKFKTYFIDIDGIVVENSSSYMKPRWGTTPAIQENVKLINELYEKGNRIILTTARRDEWSAITHNQMKEIGLKYHKIVFECGGGRRILINDFAPTNPYPSAEAISIERNGSLKGRI